MQRFILHFVRAVLYVQRVVADALKIVYAVQQLGNILAVAFVQRACRHLYKEAAKLIFICIQFAFAFLYGFGLVGIVFLHYAERIKHGILGKGGHGAGHVKAFMHGHAGGEEQPFIKEYLFALPFILPNGDYYAGQGNKLPAEGQQYKRCCGIEHAVAKRYARCVGRI